MQISDIKFYEKNAKEHPDSQVELIANSLKKWGWRSNIMVNRNGVIVAGHGRMLAYQKYPDEIKTPWVVDEYGKTIIGEAETKPFESEEDEKAYRIADNQINAVTGQNMTLITEELRVLDDAGFDITLTGFDRDIILDDDEQDDVLPETPIEPKSKVGDVYQLGPHIFVCGDSTDEEVWQKVLIGRKADCVFTDPPYNVNYSGRGKKTSEGIMNDDMDVEAFDTFLENAFRQIANAAKTGAGWYVFHSTSTQAQFENALKKFGMAIRNQLIWNKPTASMGWGDYRWKHEPFFYASREGTETVFYGDRTHSTIIDFHDSEQKLLNWAKRQKKLETEGKLTIWTMKRDKVNEYQHPTQKPVELITYALLNSSKAEDLVVDPFLGSGSTLIACQKTGRVCAGMELDPKFADVIVQRWVDYTGIEQVIRNGQKELWPRTITEHEADE